jgi:hypothetical protein
MAVRIALNAKQVNKEVAKIEIKQPVEHAGIPVGDNQPAMEKVN